MMTVFITINTVCVPAIAAVAPDTSVKESLKRIFDAKTEISEVPYHDEIRSASSKYGLPFAYVAAVARGESFFDPDARSSSGAVGIMQVMPETAASYGVSADQLLDPAINIDVGTHYLSDLLHDLGDPYLALGAYYCGPSGIKEKGLREDCDEYVRYINSHLQSMLAYSEKGTEGSRKGMAGRFVIASFDNFLDAERFRNLLESGKIEGLNLDYFRSEIRLKDHTRYQYQILAWYGNEDEKGRLCRSISDITGFVFCE